MILPRPKRRTSPHHAKAAVNSPLKVLLARGVLVHANKTNIAAASSDLPHPHLPQGAYSAKRSSWKTVLNSILRTVGALSVALVLALGSPQQALAGRSGGRVGGSAGFSRSSTYSYSRSSSGGAGFSSGPRFSSSSGFSSGFHFSSSSSSDIWEFMVTVIFTANVLVQILKIIANDEDVTGGGQLPETQAGSVWNHGCDR